MFINNLSRFMKFGRDYYLIFFHCCFLFFIASSEAYSQDKKSVKLKEIDSLLSLSGQAQAEVDVYNSLKYALEAKSLSEEYNYSEGRAKSYFFKCSGFIINGRL